MAFKFVFPLFFLHLQRTSVYRTCIPYVSFLPRVNDICQMYAVRFATAIFFCDTFIYTSYVVGVQAM